MTRATLNVRLRSAELEKLERKALLALWHRAYGGAPFKGARAGTLVRGLTYAEQSRALGGLRASTNRRLIAIAKAASNSSLEVNAPDRPDCSNTTETANVIAVANPTNLPRLQLGSQIVREWNGKTYTVHATDQGYVLNGVTYGSLSAVAKAITGAHWSGPRFFGVRV